MIGSDDIMIIGTQLSNNEHIVRTTQQWEAAAVKYKIIPRGCVCVELTQDGKTRVKIGEGNKYYEQLPYVDADIDMEEIIHIVEEYLQYYATTEYVDTKVDVVDKKVDELDEDVTSLEETVDKYDERITTVEDEVSTYDDRINSLEEKAHTHDNKPILDNTTASFTISDETKLDGIEDHANNYSLPKASDTTLGGIKVGDNLSIDNDGVLSANPGGYTLPPATTSTLGGIIVGNNLTIDTDGVLSANSGGYTLPIASDTTLGGIKVGDNLTIDASTGKLDATDTIYTLPIASTSTLGGIKVGNNLTIDPVTGVLDATGGSSITVDDHLDDQSTNPVQNAVLTPILEGLNTRIHEITANDVDLWWDMEDNNSGVIIGNAVVVVDGVVTPTPEIGSAETVTE